MTQGSRQVTLHDIAQEAALSVSTVSMALSGHPDISHQTRLRVREIGRRLNYRSRRRKRPFYFSTPTTGSQTLRLALVMVGYDNPPDYLMPLLQYQSDLAQKRNTRIEMLSIPNVNEDEQARLYDRGAGEVQGTLLDGYIRPKLYAHIATHPTPSVLMGNIMGDPLTPQQRGRCVYVDHRAMGHRATRALLRTGRRRVAFICAVMYENLWYEQWYRGYQHAHAEEGLSLDPALRLTVGPQADIGGRAARQVLAMDKLPDGYVIPNPNTAAAFLAGMKEAGRTVDSSQIVIGATAAGARRLSVQDYPRITNPNEQFARTCIDLLWSAIDGYAPDPCRLVVPFTTYRLPDQPVSNRDAEPAQMTEP